MRRVIRGRPSNTRLKLAAPFIYLLRSVHPSHSRGSSVNLDGGASRFLPMSLRARYVTTSVALIAAATCRPPLRSRVVPNDRRVTCYQLEFGRWAASSQLPFAKAAVGLVSPLPDTIALTDVATTRYGHAYHVVRKVPTDSVQATGTRAPTRGDTLVIDFPSDADAGLKMRLSGRRERLEGVAWVAFHYSLEGKGVVLADPLGPPTPWSTLTARNVPCPKALGPSSPGA